MQHLSPTDLARLVDESATRQESEHLRACSACHGELLALREQKFQLAILPDPPAPEGSWERLEARMQAEGVLRTAAMRRGAPEAFLLAAAAIALFLLGMATGHAFFDSPQVIASLETTEPGTVAEAAEAVRAAEAEYLRALTRYAELSDIGDDPDPLTRLAALEGIVLTTRAALRTAPADPVINTYHLTAIGQRDALMRRISTAEADEWF
jgi:hypothetical protein